MDGVKEGGRVEQKRRDVALLCHPEIGMKVVTLRNSSLGTATCTQYNNL